MANAGEDSDRSIEADFGQTIYGTLRKIAGAHLRQERSDHTLQATALVHEAWIRLEEDARANGATPKHFMALASQAMRRILVDHARSRGSAKRGGNWKRVTLSIDPGTDQTTAIDILDLNEALEALSSVSPRQAQIVELRFFGGLTNAQASEVLDISIPTVVREWRVAQAWLLTRISASEANQ